MATIPIPPRPEPCMAELKEARVPDIGDYDDVPVIEVLVQVGDKVAKDQGLVTLESDKATMEVPSTAAGVVKELKVKVGDKLSEGSVVAVLEAEGEAPAAAPPPPAGEVGARSATGGGASASVPPSQPSPASGGRSESAPPIAPSPAKPAEPTAPQAAAASGKTADITCHTVVLGSGPGGYTA